MGNPILELAQKTNTQLHSWGERQVVFDEKRQMLPASDVSETAETFWSIISEAFQYSNEHSESIPAERSLMDFVEERARTKYTDEPTDVQNRKRELLIREAAMWGAFVGGTIKRQSLKFFWLEECIEGENPFIADTYRKILEAIKEPALKASQLMLETEVTNVHSLTEEDCVEVHTSSGQKARFDEVVVTLPLGCLKQQKELFTPPLPVRVSSAISAIGYGNLDKACSDVQTTYVVDADGCRYTSTFRKRSGIVCPHKTVRSRAKRIRRPRTREFKQHLNTIHLNRHRVLSTSSFQGLSTGYIPHTQLKQTRICGISRGSTWPVCLCLARIRP